MSNKQKISDILEEYKSLLDKGVITESEYEDKKAELLKELDSGVNEEKKTEKTSFPSYMVIGICLGSLILAGSAVFSIVNYLANNQKNKESIEKDEIRFGSYPQEYVHGTDTKEPGKQTPSDKFYTKLKKALMEKEVDGLPDVENANGWTSFKFYDVFNEIDEQTHKSKQVTRPADYYWYEDFKFENNMYRATYNTKYHDRYPFVSAVNTIGKSSENPYYSNLVYFFKFQPIVWRKLTKKENGYTYLMSSRILDYCDYEPRTIDYDHPDMEKPNNYKTSKVRKWLNEDFFKTAFSAANVSKMELMKVDNSLASTLDEQNKFVCEDTNDYVSLLSKQELLNPDYNISSEARRSLKVTNYATSFIFTDSLNSTTTSVKYASGKTNYWLRSPTSEVVAGNTEGLNVAVVNPIGESTPVINTPTYWCDYGVVPTIAVKL